MYPITFRKWGEVKNKNIFICLGYICYIRYHKFIFFGSVFVMVLFLILLISQEDNISIKSFGEEEPRDIFPYLG